jgi:surfactin synthase thioesterase subunit
MPVDVAAVYPGRSKSSARSLIASGEIPQKVVKRMLGLSVFLQRFWLLFGWSMDCPICQRLESELKRLDDDLRLHIRSGATRPYIADRFVIA